MSLFCRFNWHSFSAWSPPERERIWRFAEGQGVRTFQRRVCLRCGLTKENEVSFTEDPISGPREVRPEVRPAAEDVTGAVAKVFVMTSARVGKRET